MASQLFQNYLYTDAGAAIVGATVELFDRNTTTPVRATTTTDANGLWSISHATEGRFDVRITNGASVRWHRYDTQSQIDTLEVANFNIRNPADTFDYAITPGAITADRILNLPVITGTDTVAVLGLAQTFTVAKTFSVAGLTATFTNSNDGASSQVAYFEGDRATPADNDLAYISLRLSDSAGNQDEGARIEWQATTVLSGATQDTDLILYALVNNTLTEMLRLDGSASEIDMAVDVDYVASAARWSSGVAVVAGEYSIQRDADATNQLHFNVPTGATYEWSVNDVVEMTLSATAVNFQNNSITTTGGGSLTGTWTDLGAVTTVDINGGTLDGVVIGGASAAAGTFTTITGTAFRVSAAGLAFINDTVNTVMTVGLTINQGAADDEAFAVKSSDVVNPFGSYVEPDTYFEILKSSATAGGALLRGLRSSAGTAGLALALEGWLGEAADTTHTAGGIGIVDATAYVTDGGTDVAAPGANANLFTVRSGTGTRFIVDQEGDLFADGSDVTVYDDYDDALVLRAFDLNRGQRGVVNTEWDSFVRHNERDLVGIGILGAPLSEGGLINYTLLSRFQTGAIWQGRKRQYEQEREIAALRSEIAELRRALPAA